MEVETLIQVLREVSALLLEPRVLGREEKRVWAEYLAGVIIDIQREDDAGGQP